MMTSCIIVLISAFLIDRILGDPRYALHPVRAIGGLITRLESGIRRLGGDSRRGGALLLIGALVSVVAAYAAVRCSLVALHAAAPVALDCFTLYSCIALRDMQRHATPIAHALDAGDTDRARALLSGIVGRDVSCLDASGIARAAIESVSESFLDGFLAPLCWFVAGAVAAPWMSLPPLPAATGAALIYRVVNTLDSMVGYKNERYRHVGWASAHADDALNLVPARLALPLLVPAAALCGLDAAAGWRVALRDRLKHASPNSAHTESFAAGALGLRLGGPTVYAHGCIDKPWIGDGTDAAAARHIVEACRLTACAGGVSTAVAVAILGGMML